MCIASNISSGYNDLFKHNHPDWFPVPTQVTIPSTATKEDIRQLRLELEELKKLIFAAKEFDKTTGQPDCQMEEKIKFLTDLAKVLGVDPKGLF